MKTLLTRVAALSLVIVSALSLSPSDGDAQSRSIYTRSMCNRLPTASQRVTCRVCVSRRPRMVYDVASNACRPWGVR